MTHYPKGGRCRACTKRLSNCSHLPFHTMPVHRQDGSDVVVICTQFVPSDGEVGKPFLNPRRGRRL
jgi:hypothetical protein